MTVDKILKQFNRTCRKLRKHADTQATVAETHVNLAQHHVDEANACRSEQARALNVADNIERMIEGS